MITEVVGSLNEFGNIGHNLYGYMRRYDDLRNFYTHGENYWALFRLKNPCYDCYRILCEYQKRIKEL